MKCLYGLSKVKEDFCKKRVNNLDLGSQSLCFDCKIGKKFPRREITGSRYSLMRGCIDMNVKRNEKMKEKRDNDNLR